MSKIKRKKSDEAPDEVQKAVRLVCQECVSRQKGGLCKTTKKFVARKRKACDKLKGKRREL